MKQFRYWQVFCFLAFSTVWSASHASAGQLYAGGATASITPDQPVALAGHHQVRIARKVEFPCTATALVIETRDQDVSLEHVAFVSCDLIAIRGGDDFYALVRDELRGRVPDTLLGRIIMSATHTHAAPYAYDVSHDLPEEAMRPADYRKFLVRTIGDIIVEAWNKRAPARVAWGLGHAVVAQNRRAVFSDGSAVMYGNTSLPTFRGIEGYEDHGVELLYFWDAQDKLIATAINIACPAQERGGNTLSADYWHPVRERLREKYGAQLVVLAWLGAAGDQSPRPMYRTAAEQRMYNLRTTDRLHDLARRIAETCEDVYEVVKQDRHDDVLLEYRSKVLQLPRRMVTEEEVRLEQEAFARLPSKATEQQRLYLQRAAARFEKQMTLPPYHEMELRAVRLGDVALVTNDFELFTDFGVQMKARSPALQTFVLQHCGPGTYVPTERAMRGGGYGAVIQTNTVGAEGGQMLVEETVKLIDSLWKKEPANPSAAAGR